MAKYVRASLYALLLIIASASVTYGIPSFRGYTGLMLIPTADALGKGDWNAGLFFEDVASGTVNDYVANYGIAQGAEIGVDVFRLTGDSDSEVLVNAKYEFMPETGARPGIAAGVIDLADQLRATAYVVASKSLTTCLRQYEGEILNPRVHVGFGGGLFHGVFAGASAYLGNRVEVMLEWDSRDLNIGGRFRVTPGFTVHAGWFNVTSRSATEPALRGSGTFGVGVSYGRSY